MTIDYKSLDWESTLNDETFAVAPDPEDDEYWFGAVSHMADGGEYDGLGDDEKHCFAFIAHVYVDPDSEDPYGDAEDACNEATNPNIFEEIGWFWTYEEGCQAILEVIGDVHNLSPRNIGIYE